MIIKSKHHPYISRIFKVGQKLTEPYYEWVSNPLYAHMMKRTCETCGFGWPTAEVPLFWGWTGAAADFCPSHLYPAPTRITLSPRTAVRQEGSYASAGALHVIGMGGVYRRRICVQCMNCGHSEGRHKDQPCSKQYKHQYRTDEHCGCENFSPCINQATGKPTRWTTGEFSPDGIVVEDVTICSICGGLGRKQLESHRQRGGRIGGARARLSKMRMRKRAREGHNGLRGPNDPPPEPPENP